MINIYYDINYIKTKKVFVTSKFRYSVFLNVLITIYNFLKRPMPEKYIFTGPHKRINNLLKTFKNSNFSLNKIKYDLTYMVTFNEEAEKLLLKLLQNNNSKIIVGPLFNVEYQKKIIDYTNKYPNIKKLVASQSAFNNAVYELGIKVNPKKVIISPSGVVESKELMKTKDAKRKDKCLIYFKKRQNEDLEKVLSFLDQKNINYEIFKYGEYKNSELKTAAKESSFGIYMARSETQGFAVQEMMACNLPLYVWDDKNLNAKILSEYYGGGKFSGTSITYWSDQNGVIVDNFEDFMKNFDFFIDNIDFYKPYKLIEKYLTYEASKKNLIEQFNNF